MNNQQKGKRNRQRGAELQREVVNLAKECNLNAHNRDRGGAQHPLGDVKIESFYFGCKRKKNIASYLKPEKQEEGVFIREDRGELYLVIKAATFLRLVEIAMLKIRKIASYKNLKNKTKEQ